METSCRASPYTTVEILEYIPFWSYFYIGARPFCVFFCYIAYSVAPPPPTICNRSTETSKHRSNRCDRRAVSDTEHNTPTLPPPPKKKSFSVPVITKCDSSRHSASSYLCLPPSSHITGHKLVQYPSSGLVCYYLHSHSITAGTNATGRRRNASINRKQD